MIGGMRAGGHDRLRSKSSRCVPCGIELRIGSKRGFRSCKCIRKENGCEVHSRGRYVRDTQFGGAKLVFKSRVEELHLVPRCSCSEIALESLEVHRCIGGDLGRISPREK